MLSPLWNQDAEIQSNALVDGRLSSQSVQDFFWLCVVPSSFLITIPLPPLPQAPTLMNLHYIFHMQAINVYQWNWAIDIVLIFTFCSQLCVVSSLPPITFGLFIHLEMNMQVAFNSAATKKAAMSNAEHAFLHSHACVSVGYTPSGTSKSCTIIRMAAAHSSPAGGACVFPFSYILNNN